MQTIHLAVVVWGKDFINTYFQAALPSHLCKGNLPDLTTKATVIYHIFTEKQDQNQIESHPLFSKLKKLADIQFHPIHVNTFPIHVMTRCHNAAFDLASWNSPILFLAPDVIYSAGAFIKFWTHLQAGIRAVLVASPRVNLHQYIEGLDRIDEESRYDSYQLVSNACRCWHPVTESLFWSNQTINVWPAHLYWQFGSEGIIAHCFHLHPALIWPQKKARMTSTIDGSFLKSTIPDESTWHLVSDSTELVAFELSQSTHMTPIASIPRSIQSVGAWLQRATEPFQRSLSMKPVIFRGNDYDDPKDIVRHSNDLIASLIHYVSHPPIDQWPLGIYRWIRRKWRKLWSV